MRTMNVPAGQASEQCAGLSAIGPRPRQIASSLPHQRHVDVINMAANLSLSSMSEYSERGAGACVGGTEK